MKKQNGVTLLETILVLSLIAVVMVGGLGLYSGASKETKLNQVKRKIVEISSTVKSVYASNKDTTGTGKYRGISQSMLEDELGLDLSNSYITYIGYYKDSNWADGKSHDSFYLELSDMSSEACTKLATSEFGQFMITPSDPIMSMISNINEAVSNCSAPGANLYIFFE